MMNSKKSVGLTAAGVQGIQPMQGRHNDFFVPVAIFHRSEISEIQGDPMLQLA